MLENLLSSCGLNGTEQAVLLALVRRGALGAGPIARVTEVKRPTVYAALNNLEQLGLVQREDRNGKTVFKSASVDMIPRILSGRAKRKFEEVEAAAGLLGPHLEALALPGEADFGSFEVSSFDSLSAAYAQLEEALALGEFAAIFNPQLAQTKATLPVVKHFLKESGARKAKIREIVVAGERTDWYLGAIKNPNHELRVLPANTELRSDIILADDAMIVLDYTRGHPSALKIKQRNLYLSMMAMFERLWKEL